jgi:anti-sigma B factor antagonist
VQINERVQGRIVIIEPSGPLSLETSAHFTETVRRLVDAGHTRLALNMAAVPSLDCRGLGALADACLVASDRGGRLTLFNLTARSRHMLTVTGMLTAMSACDSQAEAEHSFGLDRHAWPPAIAEGVKLAGRAAKCVTMST